VDLFGANTISPTPFNWVGGFGILFLALAFLLQLAHLNRQHRNLRVTSIPTEHTARVTDRRPAAR
jgi:hypothetical protein